MRHFKMVDRNQLLLMPPNLNDWVGPGHPAHFVVDFVDTLDLSDFYSDYDTDGGGRPPYDPRVMVAIFLYASMRSVTSTRQIERLMMEDIGFRFIAGNLRVDHSVISEFRKRHHKRFGQLFVAGVQLGLEAGLVRLGNVAIDGTKIRAYAAQSKRKSKDQLEQETERIKGWIGRYFQECEETDEREDLEFGKGNNGYLLPDYLRDPEQRKKWIADSLKKLAAESEQTKQEPESKPEGAGTKKLKKKLEKLKKAGAALEEQVETATQSDPTGRLKRERERKRGTPDIPKVNITDPDCRKMLFPDRTYHEGYNCQIAVDDEIGIIVATNVTQDANDLQQLLPMTLQVRDNTGWLPDNVSADTGYFAIEQLEDPRVKTVEFYVCPRAKGAREGEQTKSQAMRDRLDTDFGRWLYGTRKTVVEPVFGAIKQARKFRQLVTRGKSMVTAEWQLWCTGHNLLKLFKAGVVPA